MVTGLTASGCLIALQFIPNTLVPFAMLQFCVGLGFSGIFPSANSMAINLTSPLERGSMFGMLFSAQQVGGTIGPIIGGAIATYLNLASIFLLSGCTLLCIALFVVLKAPASLKAAPSTCAKETRSHDAIAEIKEQVASEIASQLEAEQAAAKSVRKHNNHDYEERTID